MGSHYVILSPEDMPATDPFIICKINQQQERKDYSLSKDGPCSSLLLITDRMISSSGSLSSITHPLSVLPLQFQVDPKDDDYTREAEVVSACRGSLLPWMFSTNRRPLPDRGLPGPRGENFSSSIGSRNPGSTINHQRRMQHSASTTTYSGLIRVIPAGFRPSNAQEVPTLYLILVPDYTASILPSFNRGSGSGVSGWTNAFIRDIFTS